MKITIGIKTLPPKTLKRAAKQAEIAVADQALKDTTPFVPALTGVFSNMARADGNAIVYTGDQARYLYEGKVMVDSVTGSGPMNIPDVGLRFHKGATLKPTDKDLVFTTSMHKDAQSHWMEASYAKNGDKWARVAENAIAKAIK